MLQTPGESPSGAKRILSRVLKWLAPSFGLLLIIGGVYVLQRQLAPYSYDDVVRQLSSTPLTSIVLAFLACIGAYSALVGYDALALAYIGKKLPLRRIALASFVALSLSHSLGFHMITTGGIRYRFWSTWGLSRSEIARAIAFASTSFLLGMVLVSGAVLLFEPPDTMALLGLKAAPLRVVGTILIAVVVGFLLWMRFAKRAIRVMGVELHIPRVRLAVGHLLIASSDWAMSACVAYVLLPTGHGVGLLPFTGVFLFAMLVGAIGHVPGGVGVFEALVVTLLKPHIDPPIVLGSLILYRLIYFVLPFVVGLTLMIAHEATRPEARAARRAARFLPATMPISLGILVFSAGTVLLLSSAVEMNAERMTLVQSVLPLGVIEGANFVASIVGALLLLLAWFIQRRLARAYHAAGVALAIALIASLMRGLVWEVAGLLLVVLAMLLLSRGLFTRKVELSLEPMSGAWLTGIVTVIVMTIWLGFLSFKRVPWSAELWREISLTSDLSRFMRATAGALALVLAVATVRFIRRREWRRLG